MKHVANVPALAVGQGGVYVTIVGNTEEISCQKSSNLVSLGNWLFNKCTFTV